MVAESGRERKGRAREKRWREDDRVRGEREVRGWVRGGFKTNLAAVNALLRPPDLGTAWPYQSGTGRTCLS
jgi:hypothetical protein